MTAGELPAETTRGTRLRIAEVLDERGADCDLALTRGAVAFAPLQRLEADKRGSIWAG